MSNLPAPPVSAAPNPVPAAPPAATPAPVPALGDLLWERYSILLGIKRRIHVLRAFVDELSRVSRGKRFQIRNDIVWNMVLDARDKCIIDLYSLTVEMRHGVRPPDPSVHVSRAFMRKQGLFALIRDHYTARFSRTYVPHPSDDEFEIHIGVKGRSEGFAKLFPSCPGDTPSAADIEDLCERFRVHMVPLQRDRNKNRAHVHEGDMGTAKMHSVGDLEALFAYTEDLLEGLSLVSAGAAYARQDMNHASSTETGADLVDLILFGNSDDVARLRKGRTRDELYVRLHEIDDQRKGDPDIGKHDALHFNQRQFDPAFENYLEMVSPRR